MLEISPAQVAKELLLDPGKALITVANNVIHGRSPFASRQVSYQEFSKNGVTRETVFYTGTCQPDSIKHRTRTTDRVHILYSFPKSNELQVSYRDLTEKQKILIGEGQLAADVNIEKISNGNLADGATMKLGIIDSEGKVVHEKGMVQGQSDKEILKTVFEIANGLF